MLKESVVARWCNAISCASSYFNLTGRALSELTSFGASIGNNSDTSFLSSQNCNNTIVVLETTVVIRENYDIPHHNNKSNTTGYTRITVATRVAAIISLITIVMTTCQLGLGGWGARL